MALIDLVLVPLREWRTALHVRRLWQVEIRLQWAYALRLPAWFIYRERKALGLFDFNDESFFYGETPYDVSLSICQHVGLGPDDTLFDLGCGRGKMVFASHLGCGCRAVGVDLLPTYIDNAQSIARALGLSAIRFEREDVLTIDLADATAIFINGFTFSENVAGGLRARISVLDDGVWWISVGRPWDHPRLHLHDTRLYAFSWGRAEVWFYRVGPARAGKSPQESADGGAVPSFAEVLGDTLAHLSEDSDEAQDGDRDPAGDPGPGGSLPPRRGLGPDPDRDEQSVVPRPEGG